MEMTGGLFFGSLLGYALLLMAALPGLKAGKAVLSAACAMLFVAYYGVIVCGAMVPVAYGLMYGGLAALAVCIVLAALNRRRLRQRLLSPVFWLFAAGCVLAVALCRGTILSSHDDFSYWARAVKELYTFDTFYIHENSTMFHTDYFPMLAALQYSVVRVFGWQEAFLGYVPFALVAASMAAVSECVERRWLKAALFVLLMYGFGVFGFTPYLLRSDGAMLSVFTAGLLCLLFRRDHSPAELWPVAASAAILTGFKIYSGLMFAVVLALALLVEWLRADKGLRRPLRRAFLLSAVLIVLLQLSWSVVYHLAGTPDAGLAVLLSGNPRSGQLLHSFTPEKLQLFRQLATDTFAAYGGSTLPWGWLLLLLPLALCLWLLPEKRRAVLRLLLWLVVMTVIYWVGLFGSYLVQAETAPSAVVYLSTVATPCVLCGLFLAALLWDQMESIACGGLLCAMLAGLMLLLPPAQWLSAYCYSGYVSSAVQMARAFWEDEVAEQRLPEDKGKKAMLVDCSWEGSNIRSSSKITHVYAYYGLPLRVTVLQLPYGEYDVLETMESWDLQGDLLSHGYQVAAFRVEDELYWEELCSLLNLDTEMPSTGLYDVTLDEDGLPVLTSREWEEEE